MQKQEPKIIAGDLSDEEVHGWMQGKINASRELKSQYETKNELLSRLNHTEARIAELSSEATIEVLQQEVLTHGEFSTPTEEKITIDKALFKQLLQLVLNLPDLGSHLAAVNVDSGSAPAGEVLIRLEPSDFLLRLSAALGACR